MSDLFSQPFEEDEAGSPAPRRPQRRIFSVSELTAAIRTLLETSFGDLWVEGEISNCKIWNSGHMYFTLKEQGAAQSIAQIKGVMFRTSLRYLKFKPADGLRVVAPRNPWCDAPCQSGSVWHDWQIAESWFGFTRNLSDCGSRSSLCGS